MDIPRNVKQKKNDMWLKFEKNYSDYNKKNGLYEDNSGKNKILRPLQKPRQKIKVVWANT